MDGAQFDTRIGGGSDAWDTVQAGLLLREDYFVEQIEFVYIGVAGRSSKYVGSKTDSEIYLGTKALFSLAGIGERNGT